MRPPKVEKVPKIVTYVTFLTLSVLTSITFVWSAPEAQADHPADIVLRPGTAPVRLEPNEAVWVSCEGAHNKKPLCTVKNLSGTFHVNIGNDPFTTKGNLDDALKQVKVLRDSGLCE